MRVSLASLSAVLGLASATNALPVYGTDATGELIGARDVHASVGPAGIGGLTGFGAYVDALTDFRVDWVITIGLTSVHYEYTFTGLDGSGRFKDVSYIVLDLSGDCADDPACLTNAKLDGVAIDASDILFGDIDGIVGAVKFEVGGGEGVTYEFDSNRLPVYGHLAVKDGGGSSTCPSPGNTNAVCSNGLLAGFDTEDTQDYVARPNGIVPEPVPEPRTFWLVVLGLVAMRRWHRVASGGASRPL